MLGQLVAEMLLDVSGFGAKTRHPFDHVHRQMKAIELIEHRHVEWGRRRAFLVVAPHVHIVVIFAPVGQTMNEIGIAMVGKYHRPVAREQSVEFSIADSMGMLVFGSSVMRS